MGGSFVARFRSPLSKPRRREPPNLYPPERRISLLPLVSRITVSPDLRPRLINSSSGTVRSAANNRPGRSTTPNRTAMTQYLLEQLFFFIEIVHLYLK